VITVGHLFQFFAGRHRCGLAGLMSNAKGFIVEETA
jgi:hypothetical protein